MPTSSSYARWYLFFVAFMAVFVVGNVACLVFLNGGPLNWLAIVLCSASGVSSWRTWRSETRKRTRPTSPFVTGGSVGNDFSGVDFDLAIGEIYGVRTWRMDKHGRLRAVHLPSAKAWRPGVNVAECNLSSDLATAMQGILTAHLYRGGLAIGSMPVGSVEGSPEHEKKHRVPTEGCRCGFYAYTDPDHEENRATAGNQLVVGVIKGTGRTLIGTRGFRCEKAEIVALLDPTHGGLKQQPWRRKQRRNLQRLYPDVPLLTSRRALLQAAPITQTSFDPTSDEFWSLP